ncbi:protein of unknown function [Candidatus Nitrotoga arctica]|uniref:Uncharacterized protein n=1 Tax=Candidatus Nitrotoga arctica TaxID=453162 RepID=A0ABM8YZ01_9PROT|nr:protein of unknown function [Candidatus Nitrotoga arctica]
MLVCGKMTFAIYELISLCFYALPNLYGGPDSSRLSGYTSEPPWRRHDKT